MDARMLKNRMMRWMGRVFFVFALVASSGVQAASKCKLWQNTQCAFTYTTQYLKCMYPTELEATRAHYEGINALQAARGLPLMTITSCDEVTQECPFTWGSSSGITGAPCFLWDTPKFTITLAGDTSVEPWHKKHDADHKKTNLKYTATVKDASDQPAPNVEVTITTEVTQDSGGHVHIDGRLKGKLVETPSGTPTPVSTLSGKDTINGKTDSNGIFTFTFGSEEASGTHTITAKCDGDKCKDPATATVKVEIQGLSLLDGNPSSYTLNGETSTHPGSHYFSAAAMTKIINLAFGYSHDPAFNHQLLIINDSSLIKGGVFDLGQDWTYTPNGHQGHRRGVVVDINNYLAEDPDFVIFAKNCCGIKAVWEGPDVTSTPHYHLWLIGKDQ
jgi:hypothetical protein